MGSSYAFVGVFAARGPTLARLRAALPARVSAVAEVLETGVIHDRVYSKTGLTIARVCDRSARAELIASVREAIATIARVGGTGAGDLVGFVDSASKTGVHFEIRDGELRETALATAKAVAAVQASKAYRALVERHAAAVADDDDGDAEAPSADTATTRAAIVARLAGLPDATLIATLRKTKLATYEAGKKVPLHARYASAKALRAVLAKGGKEWCDEINDAPLAMLAVIDAPAALGFARRIVDARTDPFDPFARSAVAVLGRSDADADVARVWRAFDTDRGFGRDELLASKHPRVDAMLFAALRDELGAPPAYRMPWEQGRSGILAHLLFQRGYAPAIAVLEEAARLHPWKHFFQFALA